MLETKDLILRKAVQEDWRGMYYNLWCYSESAKYMFWNVTTSEEDAVARMERTRAFQATHDHHWLVIEKSSGQAIGFAGLEVTEPDVCSETGVALGPAFVGKGYGKQILNALTEYARDQLGAKKFKACCREQNVASKKLQISCGFHYTRSEPKIDPRDGSDYVMEYYEKEI